MSGVTYCPFWGMKEGECRWSYDSTGQSAKRYLDTHLRVNHKGQTAPVQSPSASIRGARPDSPLTRPRAIVPAPAPVVPAAVADQRPRPGEIDRPKAARPRREAPAARETAKPKKAGRGVVVSWTECVRALQDAATELGHSPTSKWWKEEKKTPSHATIYKRLGGTWSEVLKAAGLAPVDPEAAPAAVARQAVRTSDLISFLLQRSSLGEIREMRNDAVDRVAQHRLIAEQAQAEADLLDLALERLAA